MLCEESKPNLPKAGHYFLIQKTGEVYLVHSVKQQQGGMSEGSESGNQPLLVIHCDLKQPGVIQWPKDMISFDACFQGRLLPCDQLEMMLDPLK